MTTDNTEKILDLAYKVRTQKEQERKPEKCLRGAHWTRLASGIRSQASKQNIKITGDIADSDKARFVLELGAENLVGFYRRIGEKYSRLLVTEAIDFLDEGPECHPKV
jgi:hypothetical protein